MKKQPKNEKELRMLFEKANQNLPLPQGLSKEAVEDLLSGQENPTQKNAVIRRKRGRVLVSLAAVLAIVIGVGALWRAGVFSRQPAEIVDGEQDAAIQESFRFPDGLSSYETAEQVRTDAAKAAAQQQLDGLLDSVFNQPMKNGADGTATGTGTAADAGKTNVQTTGVDEGDILKNDGRYLYYLCFPEGEEEAPSVRILDGQNPRNLRQANRIFLPQEEGRTVTPCEMYLYENFLVILVSESNQYEPDIAADADNKTRLFLYDISAPEEPKPVAEFYQDGWYLSSRLTGGRLLLWSDYQADLSDREAARATCLPETSAGVLPADRLAAAGAYGSAYTVVTSYDLATQKTESAAVCSGGGTFESYCTMDTLYLAVSDPDALPELNEGIYNTGMKRAAAEATRLIAFTFADGLECRATGVLPGNPLNQFSLDEDGDYLRAATMVYDEEPSTAVTILKKKDLSSVGCLTGIAPGEQMMAARFVGDICYLVTFLQVDPLFCVDCSDPYAPAVIGELKIPGFSSYLHPYADGLLLGVGVGGDENGTEDSVRISLFDVSDPAQPVCISFADMPNALLTGGFSHKDFFDLGGGLYGVAAERTAETFAEKENSGFVLIFSVEDQQIRGLESIPAPGQNGNSFGVRASYIGDTLFILSNYGIASYSRGAQEIDTLLFHSPTVDSGSTAARASEEPQT